MGEASNRAFSRARCYPMQTRSKFGRPYRVGSGQRYFESHRPGIAGRKQLFYALTFCAELIAVEMSFTNSGQGDLRGSERIGLVG